MKDSLHSLSFQHREERDINTLYTAFYSDKEAMHDSYWCCSEFKDGATTFMADIL